MSPTLRTQSHVLCNQLLGTAMMMSNEGLDVLSDQLLDVMELIQARLDETHPARTKEPV